MSDLRSQLLAYVDATIERVDVDQVLTRGRLVEPLRASFWRRRPLVATAVAVVALALVGGMTLLTLWLTGGNAPVATTVPVTTTTTSTSTTTSAPSTTTTTLPALDPATTAAWAAHVLIRLEEDIPPFLGGGHIINDLASNDRVVVAVGDATNQDENAMRDGLLWVSEDGRTWERVLEPEVFEFGGKGITTVVAGGPGFVAGGVACDTEERCTAGWRAALWTSEDGRTWARVPHDRALFGERSGVYELTVFGDRVLAYGLRCADVTCSGVIWSSTDGTVWEEAYVAEGFDVSAIETGPDGLVAVGAAASDSGSYAAVWTSSDGMSWQPVPHDPDVFGDGIGTEARMVDVALGTDGWVAVGNDGTQPVLWFSEDGALWERLDLGTNLPPGAWLNGVYAWGDGFVAIGPDWAITEEIGGPVPGLPSETSPPTLWISSDGRTWHPIALGVDVGALRSLTSFRGMLLVAGQYGSFIEGEDAIWVNEQPPTLVE